MRITDISPIGEQIITDKGAVIIGISLENSYFTRENLERILCWARQNAGRIYIMIPDEPAIYTMMGKGYSKEKATTKARLKANALENKCREIAVGLDILITIVRWNTVTQKTSYGVNLHHIKEVYKWDKRFRNEMRNTTIEVLSLGGKIPTTREQIDIGVNFLMQELAFLVDAAHILSESSVAYVYHKTMPLLKACLEDEYKITNMRGLPVGYITLENEV